MVSHHTNRILIKTQVHFQLSIINVVHRGKGREYSIKKKYIYIPSWKQESLSKMCNKNEFKIYKVFAKTCMYHAWIKTWVLWHFKPFCISRSTQSMGADCKGRICWIFQRPHAQATATVCLVESTASQKIILTTFSLIDLTQVTQSTQNVFGRTIAGDWQQPLSTITVYRCCESLLIPSSTY